MRSFKSAANSANAAAACGSETVLANLSKIATGHFPDRARELFVRVHFVTLARIRGALAGVPVILIVDDEEAIQGIVVDALTDAGFDTAVARTGEEAVTLIKGARVPYSALVTDIKLLGRFDGLEVARAARDVDPHFPVVYMSGVVADQWTVHGVPNSVMLQKPFAPAQLGTAISQLLNRSGNGGQR